MTHRPSPNQTPDPRTLLDTYATTHQAAPELLDALRTILDSCDLVEELIPHSTPVVPVSILRATIRHAFPQNAPEEDDTVTALRAEYAELHAQLRTEQASGAAALARYNHLRGALKPLGEITRAGGGWTDRCWLCGHVDHGHPTDLAAWTNLTTHWNPPTSPVVLPCIAPRALTDRLQAAEQCVLAIHEALTHEIPDGVHDYDLARENLVALIRERTGTPLCQRCEIDNDGICECDTREESPVVARYATTHGDEWRVHADNTVTRHRAPHHVHADFTPDQLATQADAGELRRIPVDEPRDAWHIPFCACISWARRSLPPFSPHHPDCDGTGHRKDTRPCNYDTGVCNCDRRPTCQAPQDTT